MGLVSQLTKAQQLWQKTTWISKDSLSTPTQGVIWANFLNPLMNLIEVYSSYIGSLWVFNKDIQDVRAEVMGTLP